MPYTKDFELSVGDRVKITTGGSEYIGSVKSAYWHKTDGWFVRIDKDDGSYGCWIEHQDSGTIEKISDAKLDAEEAKIFDLGECATMMWRVEQLLSRNFAPNTELVLQAKSLRGQVNAMMKQLSVK